MLTWPNRSIEEYINLLKSPDGQVRTQAAAALDILNATQAVEPLIKVLTDADKNVRLRAAQTLGKLGNTLAVTPLIGLLEDPEWEIRSQAVRSLEGLKDLRAIPALCKLLQDREGDVSYHVVMALGHMPDPLALQPLLEMLKEGDKNRSFMAARTLGSLGEVALGPLIEVLQHPSGPVRSLAAMALIYFEDERAIRALIKALQEDPDYEVKREAMRSLESLRQRHFNLLPTGESVDESEELEGRTDETDLMDTYDQAELWHQVKQVLEQHKPDNLENASIEELLARLTQPDWPVRFWAVQQLGKRQDPQALEPLLTALNDPSEEVRAGVVIALANLGDERVIEPLIGVLKDESLNHVYNCLNQLGKKAVPALITALKNESVRIRMRAASLLGEIGDPSALPALTEVEHYDISVDPVEGAIKDVAARAIRSLNAALNLKGIETKLAEARANLLKEGYRWQELLADWRKTLLDYNDLIQMPSPAELVAQWSGKNGASEEQIARAEARLEMKLPPSYRAFLKVSNGCGELNDPIGQLWPVEEIEWFAVRNQDWIDAWNMPDVVSEVSDEEYFVYGDEQSDVCIRSQYLKTSLEISEVRDLAVVLLNPQVVTADGEWEAWLFAAWFPGARRHRSFWELMQEEYIAFLSYLHSVQSRTNM